MLNVESGSQGPWRRFQSWSKEWWALQSAAFLFCSLRDSQINASLSATTLTLTLISSQLVERDIFLLKPFPCSWLECLRKRRRRPWLLVVILVWLQELWWMVRSQGSHRTKRCLETGGYYTLGERFTLKQAEAKKGAGRRSSNWVFPMCKVLEGNLHV